MNAKLFINYRREDSAPYAGRLYDHLTAYLGKDQVFIDINQIEPGEDFVEVIKNKVGSCDIAIVMIGPRWLGATDESGKRRLDDKEDFVRIEIVAALQRKIRVIPVLVGGAQMPGNKDLPEALAPLSRRNAIELSETRYQDDVNRLIEAIKRAYADVEEKAELSATPAAPTPEPAAVRSPESKDLPEPPGPATDSHAVATVGKTQHVAEPVQSKSTLTPPEFSLWRSAKLGAFAAIILGVIVLFFFLAEPGKKFVTGSASSGSAALNPETPVPQATLSTAESMPTSSTAPQRVELSEVDERAYIQQAQDALKKHDYQQALTDTQKVLEAKPDDFFAIKIRGFAEIGLSQWFKAIDDFSTVIQNKPDDLQSYDRRALAYRGLKDFDAAVADYTFLLEKNPNDVEALNKRGYTYSLMGDYEKAIPDYQAALKLNPQDNDTFQRLQYAESMLASKTAH